MITKPGNFFCGIYCDQRHYNNNNNIKIIHLITTFATRVAESGEEWDRGVDTFKWTLKTKKPTTLNLNHVGLQKENRRTKRGKEKKLKGRQKV